MGFFNLFVSGMSCTAQIRGKKEESMFLLKQIIVKFRAWKLSLGGVMGLAHLSFIHRVSKASVVKLPVEWAGEGDSNPSDFTGK